ncbi:MAG TPA: hypothetical protein HPP76_08220 [Desulfuromonadales bacterium]|nr:hypothetical protein [Desulfuromonadales bacterium]
MRRFTLVFMAVVAAFALAACGRRGALIYPDLLVPAAPSSVAVGQSGAGLRLQFTLPKQDRAGRKLMDMTGVIISKRASDPGGFQCPACDSDFKPFATLYLDALPQGVLRSGDRLLVMDGDVSSGKSYAYRIVPVTKDGREGVSSTSTGLTVVSPLPPPAVSAESLPTEIRILFSSPPVPGGNPVGYNLYRVQGEGIFPLVPLNREPLPDVTYNDSALERKTAYRYQARSVVRLDTGVVLESLPSAEVRGMLKDDE